VIELHGEIDPGRPLLVVAVAEEAEALRQLGLPLLITGAGKVNAAIATASALADRLPACVVNLGTAGALVNGLDGIHEIGTVIQHDLDDASLRELTGRTFGPPVEIGSGPTLATGDVFVSDPQLRAGLAERAQLVDMEGYGVARAATARGVEVRLVKHVSDGSDGDAHRSWREAVAACADELAAWASAELLPPEGNPAATA